MQEFQEHLHCPQQYSRNIPPPQIHVLPFVPPDFRSWFEKNLLS